MREKVVPMAEKLGYRVTFSSERSVQDELNRESYTDAPTVSISYLVMFVYIAFAMTNLPPGGTWPSNLVYCRVGLGAAGTVTPHSCFMRSAACDDLPVQATRHPSIV